MHGKYNDCQSFELVAVLAEKSCENLETYIKVR